MSRKINKSLPCIAVITAVILTIISLSINELHAQKRNYQTDPPSEKIARDLMIYGNYISAINEYLLLLKIDSLNFIYNHNIGICYINTDLDRSKAIKYLEYASSNPKADINVWYDLGRAYQYAYRFDDAIAAYNKFKGLSPAKNDNLISPDRQIEMCNNAKSMINNPVSVTFENLGPAINTLYPEYNPYVSRDESFIIFNSRRKGNVGNLEDFDGYNTSDLYITEFKYGEWKKAKRFSSLINTALVEEAVGMSSDGSRLYIFLDNEFGRFEVFESKLSGKAYQRPVSLGPNINFSNKLVTSATISKNKKVLFFACDRESKEGFGGLDIYMSTILPSGEWGPAVNLGETINTKFDEDFPYIGPDGKTLYFASMGHNSMGDFDLFKTVWDQETNTFSKPVNLGYPINTPEDNKTISFTSSGRYAYMHARRNDTYGDLDLYRIVFKDVEPVYSIINGYILSAGDSLGIYEHYDAVKTLMISEEEPAPIPSNAKNKKTTGKNVDETVSKPELPDLQISISTYNKKNNKLYGTYTPNKLSSKYTIILPPGEFIIKVKSNYYEEHTTEINIEDRDSRDIYLSRNIRLSTPKKTEPADNPEQ